MSRSAVMRTGSRNAATPRRVARSVRRQAAAESGPGVLYFTVLIALTVCFSLAYVWLRMQRIEMAYRLSQNQQQEMALDKEHRRLVYTLATLKESKRLERIAREELGLRLPTPGQVIVLSEEARP